MSSCSCVGIKRDSCSCAILSNTYLREARNSNIIFVPNKRNLEYPFERKKPSMFNKILEDVYDMCVAYNIRHCAFTPRYSKERNVKHALKDCILLLCFLVANTVVFLTLLTRTVYHTSGIILNLFNWILRTLSKNLKVYLKNEKAGKDWMSSLCSEQLNIVENSRKIENYAT
ncbi:uncharacterized protein LOC123705013 [Colias croceus]|uniref:uncharacterized protein LOC123705013 n=1 Tax=Colias crocea TaxID=72248 RepID=UPI001E27FC8B|nr:uncharacterized protein LOC123705013 [Colias croceus]